MCPLFCFGYIFFKAECTFLVMGRCKFQLVILSNLSESLNYYSPWNHQKPYGFLMISVSLICSNLGNFRSKIRWRSLKDTVLSIWQLLGHENLLVKFLVKFSHWSKFHVNIITGSGVTTTFVHKRLTRNADIIDTVPSSEFCLISGDWDKLGIPNWHECLQWRVTEWCKTAGFQLLPFWTY